MRWLSSHGHDWTTDGPGSYRSRQQAFANGNHRIDSVAVPKHLIAFHQPCDRDDGRKILYGTGCVERISQVPPFASPPIRCDSTKPSRSQSMTLIRKRFRRSLQCLKDCWTRLLAKRSETCWRLFSPVVATDVFLAPGEFRLRQPIDAVCPVSILRSVQPPTGRTTEMT